MIKGTVPVYVVAIAVLAGACIGLSGGLKLAENDPAIRAVKQEAADRQERLAWFVGSDCTRRTEGQSSALSKDEFNCHEVCDLFGSDELRAKCDQGVVSGFVYLSITQ